MRERVRGQIGVAESPVERERGFVGLDRLLQLAAVLARHPDAVPGGGLDAELTGLAGE
jgi:hypothetical protein